MFGDAQWSCMFGSSDPIRIATKGIKTYMKSLGKEVWSMFVDVL